MRYLVFKIVQETGRIRNPYDGSPRVWHETFEIAKAEAERLCLKEECEFIILAEAARVNPQPKTIFQDLRKDI
jgi:hypothetical protein